MSDLGRRRSPPAISRRWLIVLAVTAVLAAACSSTDSAIDASGASSSEAFAVEQIAGDAPEDVPSALDGMTGDGLPAPLVDPSEVQSGGPPPDGIPPIDEPTFHRAGEVDFLQDTEPVLAVEVDGEARAYPVQVLIWHEIVNDTIAGVPVSITYCPLCNTAVGVDRRVDDRVLTFGTSGSLYQSSLVMYDRQTESLWSHFTGQAIAGVLTGTELDTIPVATIGWADWLEAHPDGLVLSRDTGFDRDYGANPYPGYDDVETSPFLFDGDADSRLAAKERVVGTGLDEGPIAIRLEPLLADGVIEAELAGAPITIWALPGTSSALEGLDVSDGRDVGATGVFMATHEDRVLTFERGDGEFVDIETGSRWNVLGTAVAGPLAGTKLQAIEHVDTFWFAWAAFAPDTQVIPSLAEE